MKYQGKEMRDAHVLHWSMGSNYWNTLIEFDPYVGRSCRTCGGRDCIVSDWWGCSHCGAPIIDMRVTELSPSQIDDITCNPCRCAECGQVMFPKEYVSCSNCQNPARATLFDVRLQLKITPGATSTQNQLTIVGWSNPAPIDQRFAAITKPMDLPKLFAPDSLERQAQILQLDTGNNKTAQAPAYREYSAAPVPQEPQQTYHPAQGFAPAPGSPRPQAPVYPPSPFQQTAVNAINPMAYPPPATHPFHQ